MEDTWCTFWKHQIKYNQISFGVPSLRIITIIMGAQNDTKRSTQDEYTAPYQNGRKSETAQCRKFKQFAFRVFTFSKHT